MRETLLLVPDQVLAAPSKAALHDGWAVAVSGGNVTGLGPAAAVEASHPGAVRVDLPGCILLPGLINAHQHGRGIGTLQQGIADGPLELWINARRWKTATDGGAFARLAAAAMLANGVTTAVHANYAYGTGDYAAEVRAQLEAYVAAGFRVTFCLGAQDRGFVVYPPFTAADLGPLPPAAARYVAAARSPYAESTPALLQLMDRLLDEWGDHPLVTLCWGPAGPQWVSDALFRSLAGHADVNGLGLHLHCLESPVQAAVCQRLYPSGTLRHLAELGVLGPRTVLAHAVHLTDEDIHVAADHGIIVAHNPGSNLRLCNGVAPIGRLLAAGVRVALGTDNTALLDDEDLLAELKLMAGLARDPDHGGVLLEASTLLQAVTTAAAAAAQQPERLGRMAPGLPADLVALDTTGMGGAYLDAAIDPLEAIAARARGRAVRLTMVAGRILYRHGQFPHLDMLEVEAAARDAALAAKLPTDPTLPDTTEALARALARVYRPLVQPSSGARTQELES